MTQSEGDYYSSDDETELNTHDGWIATSDLIGIPDGQCTNRKDLRNVLLSRIGGHAVPIPGTCVPDVACGNCLSPLFLLGQIHAPLPNAATRIIYVFACNRRVCTNHVGSFVVLRAISVDPKPCTAEPHDRSPPPPKLNFSVPGVDTFAFNKDPSPIPVQVDLFKPIPPTFNLNPIVPKSKKQSKSLNKKQTAASSAIESLSTSFGSKLKLVRPPLDQPAFPVYYINVEIEYIRSQKSKSSAYAEYQPSRSSGEDWDVEKMESTVIRGFTTHLQKFMARIEDNPTQVIRYNYTGDPLLYSNFNIVHGMNYVRASGTLDVPKCERCGSSRVYECQLMPALLSLLPIEALASPHSNMPNGAHPDQWCSGLEFGTVLVYVCSRDCSISSGTKVHYIPEVCIVQLEQD